MKKKLCLMLLLLPVVGFFIPIHAEETKIYDENWNLKYRTEDNGRIYDKDWNLKGRQQDDRIYDKNWNLKGRINKR